MTFTKTLFSLLFGLALSVHANQSPVDSVIRPVLQGREGFFEIRTLEIEPDRLRIVVKSTSNKIQFGEYSIEFNKSNGALVSPPDIQVTSKMVRGVPVLTPRAELLLPWPSDTNIEKLQGLLRSALRADFLLHPLQTPPGQSPRLDPKQYQAIKELIAQNKNAISLGQPQRSLLVFPPGFGKTLMSSRFVKRLLAESDANQTHIIFAVENFDVLVDARQRFQADLALKPTEIGSLFGEGSSQRSINWNHRLTVASRSGLYRNLPHLLAHLASSQKRLVLVLNEAQHLGRANGQFDEILNRINPLLKPGDVILGMSGSPWHIETDIVKRLFADNVVTSFLTPEESRIFLANNNEVDMARAIAFRAMAQGYLSPISEFRHVDYFDGDERFLSRNYLRDWELKVLDAPPEQQEEVLRRSIKVHEPFLRNMLDEIRATFAEAEKGHVFNRGAIFVPSIAHAEVYAFMLNRYKSPGVTFRAYHSDLSNGLRQQRMEWFTDLKARQHRYLIIINTGGEGLDVPAMNHLVLAKPYSSLDRVALRELLQNLGRIMRTTYGKTRTFVTDYTGDMRRLLLEGLDRLPGNFRSDEILVRPLLEGPSRRPPVEMHFDKNTLNEVGFRPTDVQLPANELQKLNLGSEDAAKPSTGVPPAVPPAIPEASRPESASGDSSSDVNFRAKTEPDSMQRGRTIESPRPGGTPSWEPEIPKPPIRSEKEILDSLTEPWTKARLLVHPLGLVLLAQDVLKDPGFLNKRRDTVDSFLVALIKMRGFGLAGISDVPRKNIIKFDVFYQRLLNKLKGLGIPPLHSHMLKPMLESGDPQFLADVPDQRLEELLIKAYPQLAEKVPFSTLDLMNISLALAERAIKLIRVSDLRAEKHTISDFLNSRFHYKPDLATSAPSLAISIPDVSNESKTKKLLTLLGLSRKEYESILPENLKLLQKMYKSPEIDRPRILRPWTKARFLVHPMGLLLLEGHALHSKTPVRIYQGRQSIHLLGVRPLGILELQTQNRRTNNLFKVVSRTLPDESFFPNEGIQPGKFLELDREVASYTSDQWHTFFRHLTANGFSPLGLTESELFDLGIRATQRLYDSEVIERLIAPNLSDQIDKWERRLIELRPELAEPSIFSDFHLLTLRARTSELWRHSLQERENYFGKLSAMDRTGAAPQDTYLEVMSPPKPKPLFTLEIIRELLHLPPGLKLDATDLVEVHQLTGAVPPKNTTASSCQSLF